MDVQLLSYSQPTEKFADMGLGNAQELIAYCARVSNPSNQLNTDTSDKLIRYLVKHQHWSPLEMVSACCEITTTRDIARQILRHRSFSFVNGYTYYEGFNEYFDTTRIRYESQGVIYEPGVKTSNGSQAAIDSLGMPVKFSIW